MPQQDTSNKNVFVQKQEKYLSHFCAETYILVEAPYQGTANEYPQHNHYVFVQK